MGMGGWEIAGLGDYIWVWYRDYLHASTTRTTDYILHPPSYTLHLHPELTPVSHAVPSPPRLLFSPLSTSLLPTHILTRIVVISCSLLSHHHLSHR